MAAYIAELWKDSVLFQRLDLAAGTTTTFNKDGTVASSAPLTVAQISDLTEAANAQTEGDNEQTLVAKAQAALATNAAALALPDPTPGNQTYLAIGAPTTAQAVAQVAALTRQVDALVSQVQALTKQSSALIRIALSQFDSTSGT